jgi:hypothetical protein
MLTVSTCDCFACREARDAKVRDNEGCTCPFMAWNPECPSHGFKRKDK